MHRNAFGATIAVLILPLLALPGAALAHGEIGEHVSEFQGHMDEYAADISALIDKADAIVADYAADGDPADAIDELTEQWESVDFHEAVETKAMPLYPPIWAALGRFSSALKDGAPAATIQARRDDFAAALWQGYGALKLLAARAEAGHGGHGDESEAHHEAAHADGAAVIDTINANLDQVLALHKKGDTEKAQKLIFDTYMSYFEGIEGDLIEQDAELVSGLELAFNATLPELLKSGAPADQVAARIDAMQDKLNHARTLLEQAESQETSVF